VVRPLGSLLQHDTVLRGIDCALDVGVYLLLEEDLAERHELVGCHHHIELEMSDKVVLQPFEF